MSYIIRSGNLAKTPELRHGEKTTYCYARVICTDRIRTNDGEFIDGSPMAYNLTIFGGQAEQLVNTATVSGYVRVLFTGDYTVSEYTNKDGEVRTSHDVRVDEIGISLRHQIITAHSTKNDN